MTRSYIESTIHACGREYVIKVVDAHNKPFKVCVATPQGPLELNAYDNRSDAIRDATKRALAWIDGFCLEEVQQVL